MWTKQQIKDTLNSIHLGDEKKYPRLCGGLLLQ